VVRVDLRAVDRVLRPGGVRATDSSATVVALLAAGRLPRGEGRRRLALALAGSRGVLLIARSTAGLERCDRVLRLRDGAFDDAA
jgi:hypothetical protein